MNLRSFALQLLVNRNCARLDPFMNAYPATCLGQLLSDRNHLFDYGIASPGEDVRGLDSDMGKAHDDEEDEE